jgi:short-subunit dehydrogenase
MYSLAEKVVIITGASQGIGAQLAQQLHRKGAKLSLAARNEELLRQVAAGTEAVISAGDLTEETARAQLIDRTVERWGRIDVLINNAGRGSYYKLAETSLSESRALFDLNFTVPLALAQLALPYLERTRGSIVNVGSIAGLVSLPWMGIYSATKFAVTSLTIGERAEFGRRGVHVMGVYPGYVDTEFQAHAPGPRPPGYVVQSRRFAVSAEVCAASIVRGLEARKNSVVTPAAGWLLIWANRIFPGLVESRLGSLQ